MSEREAVIARSETPGRKAAAVMFDDDLRHRLLDALLAPAEPPRMTYEEFLAWAGEDTLAEWIALEGGVGKVMMYSPASKRHQQLASFLERVLGMFVEQRDLGVVLVTPFQMKLEHGREPDLLFVAREHLGRLKETYLDGPADLVVEIVSPESEGRDRGEKFYEYARGGVSEYWLIDPQIQWADFYQLEGERYRTVFSGEEGEYHALVLPDFRLRVEWLWQEPLPNPLRVLGEIANVDPEVVERFLQALGG